MAKEFELKLQQTINMMQEIGNLVTESDTLMQQSKDDAFTRTSILKLKQSILNQNSVNFEETQSRLSDPPVKTYKNKEGKEVTVLDFKLITRLRKELQQLETRLSVSRNAVDRAQGDVVESRTQATANNQIKATLESDLDSLHGQVSSILSTIKNEKKTLTKTRDGDPDPGFEREARHNNPKAGYSDYVNDNNHIGDFHNAIDGTATNTSYMSVDSIE